MTEKTVHFSDIFQKELFVLKFKSVFGFCQKLLEQKNQNHSVDLCRNSPGNRIGNHQVFQCRILGKYVQNPEYTEHTDPDYRDHRSR